MRSLSWLANPAATLDCALRRSRHPAADNVIVTPSHFRAIANRAYCSDISRGDRPGPSVTSASTVYRAAAKCAQVDAADNPHVRLQ